MNNVIATGLEAIEIAEREGGLLCKYADPTQGARGGLSVREAREIAEEDPSLICLRDIDAAPSRRDIEGHINNTGLGFDRDEIADLVAYGLTLDAEDWEEELDAEFERRTNRELADRALSRALD